MSTTCLYIMANFDPLTTEICWPVWGTPTNFNGFRILPSLLQRRRSPEANQVLHDVWPSPGLLHCIYIFVGYCPPDRILPGAKFTLRLGLAFFPLPSNRHHRSSGDCLEGKGESIRSVLCNIVCNIVHSAMHRHMNRLTVLWIEFCITGPISLCLDSFLSCVLLCVVCMRKFVTR